MPGTPYPNDLTQQLLLAVYHNYKKSVYGSSTVGNVFV